MEEPGGGTLPLDPWAHQGMEISDRPTILPITHDPNISDKMAFKQRPLRDGGGKPSLGRLAPWARPLCPHFVVGELQESLPPLTSPGIWPLKTELKGEEPEFQELPRNYPSADHFSELIRGTFLEEVPMGMVEGPFSKEAAASRCGCDSEDLCPGPLAGIDEGDKIRTIYDGSVGGANDTIRNQTVERTTAPTVLDGVQALHWLHAAAEEGPPSQGASGPEGGIVKPPPGSWLWPEPGTRCVLLKADITKAHLRVPPLTMIEPMVRSLSIPKGMLPLPFQFGPRGPPDLRP